jgi:Arc/MetJ-type ribon-helix-helix transcriptional regulator
MKVSVSLPQDDVEFLDALVQESVADSRSAALHQAVASLRASRLESAYEAAWAEWSGSKDNEAWEGVVGDGVDAPR